MQEVFSKTTITTLPLNEHNEPVALSDMELIGKIGEDSEPAFEKLFRKYYTSLVLFALKFTGNREDAEEITQQLFVNVWDKRKDIVFKTSVKAYLFSSIRNNCLDYLKHKKIKQNYAEKIIREYQKENFPRFDLYTSKETINRINNAIESLPDQRKRVFKMNRFEGYKYKEIANKLDITEKTVENHIGTALKQLRELLGDLIPVLFPLFLLFINHRGIV